MDSVHVSAVDVWFLCKTVNALFPSQWLRVMVSLFINGDLTDPRILSSRPRCVHRFHIPDSPGGNLKKLKEDSLGGVLVAAQMILCCSDVLLGVGCSCQRKHVDVRGSRVVLM